VGTAHQRARADDHHADHHDDDNDESDGTDEPVEHHDERPSDVRPADARGADHHNTGTAGRAAVSVFARAGAVTDPDELTEAQIGHRYTGVP
jgi:hypothetical protein